VSGHVSSRVVDISDDAPSRLDARLSANNSRVYVIRL